MAKDSKKIIRLEPKSIEEPKKTPQINIGPIGTLNLVLNPLKERYEKIYQKNKLHIIYDILLALAIIALLFINFRLWYGPIRLSDVLSLEIKINPTPVISGDWTNYAISYQNKSKEALKDVNLVLRLPQGFILEKYFPTSFDIKNNTLKIGDLEPAGHGEMKISGQVLGPVGEYQKIIAILNYQDKKGRTGQQIFASSYPVEASILEAILELPEIISSHGQFEANLSLKNHSNYEFNKIKLTIKWPDKFVLLQSEIEPTTGNNEWLFEKIKAGEIKKFKITGKISAQEIKPVAIETELSIYHENQYLLQDKKSKELNLIFSELALEFLDKGKNENINPGEVMVYKISYKNNEDYNLNNLNLTLGLVGEFIDWDYLQKNYNTNENKIIWTKNQINQLENLEPGKEGRIEITIKILPAIKLEKINEEGFKIKATIEGIYLNPKIGKNVYTESEPLETKINSILKIKSFALYYTKEGDQLGIGPIPPQVGKTTKYWLFLQIHNTINQVNNVEVIAHLPEGIEITEKSNVTEGNNLEFDNNSRIIKWTLDNVSAYVPTFYPSPEARIEVVIKPTNQDFDKFITLLDNIKISGIDSFIGVKLEAAGEKVTTDIFKDKNLGRIK
jgi:hypothetical protein